MPFEALEEIEPILEVARKAIHGVDDDQIGAKLRQISDHSQELIASFERFSRPGFA